MDSLHPTRLNIPPRSPSGHSQDISPPDSPRTGDFETSSSPNVSPVTDSGYSRPTGIPAPVPTRNISGTSAYIAGWREKIGGSGPTTQVPKRKDTNPTKWDKYSGEPTDSLRGREGQIQPGSTAFDSPLMGSSTMISTGRPMEPKPPNLFSQTLRRVGRRESSSNPPPREEWKGASGRHAIVAPPADNPRAKQKALPTPSQRRNRQALKTGTRHPIARDTPSPGPAISSTTEPDLVTSPSPSKSAAENNVVEIEQRIAAQLARGGRLSLASNDRLEDVSARTSSLPPSQVSSPITRSRQTQSNQTSAAGTPQRIESPPAASSPFNPATYLDPQISLSLQNMGFSNEPGSRFSATTYSTTIPDSRPMTPDTLSIRENSVNTPAVQPSILNRKRPIPSAPQYPTVKSGFKPPSRKPTPSQINVTGSPTIANGSTGVWSPPGSTTSALVEQPAEEPDRVAQLEAHISALHKRKQNITTVINELTSVAQPTSIAYDHTSRVEIKKTVSGMTAELASVHKDIHDTGLKLHRALKKRDEEMNGEGSGLWIRRVTE